MPQRTSKWKSVSLPAEVIDEIKAILKKNPELGYNSVAEFVMDSIRKNPNYLERMEHYNVYGDHVTIYDSYKKNLADIYFHDNGPYCDLCETKNCEHIDFALTLPKVINLLTDRGWVIKEGKIVHPPF
jgi:hypothetical protein